MASRDYNTEDQDSPARAFVERAPDLSPGESARHPHVDYDLFRAVQLAGLFDDSKEFVDHVLQADPETVQKRYRERRDHPEFDLDSFVTEHYEGPPEIDDFSVDAATMEGHVSKLWERLAKPQDADNEHDSLISLPNPHVVPGGRFRESYYWDTYFIAEGLAAEGRLDVVEDMAENFASLIDRFGFVPNGNRRYLLTRSQPPLFSELVAILARERGIDAIREYLPRLEREYEFWMEGRDELTDERPAVHRVVQVDDAVLNRYWDGTASPRPESYREDVALARLVPEYDRAKLYRDVRAACESGWDFSGRWLADPEAFESIRTTDLVPIDLNAFMFALEHRLATWFTAVDDEERAERYRQAARSRREAIDEHCWDDDAGFYFDYDHVREEHTEAWSLAAVAPLYVGLADEAQAAAVANVLEERFLEPGGLVTTQRRTGEQWDAPNGWAPLQWMAIHGLRRYGHDELAGEISQRWIDLNRTVYDDHGVLLEKYDVTPGGHAGGGGEYPLQTGFGWTNGVAIALQDPDGTMAGDGVSRP